MEVAIGAIDLNCTMDSKDTDSDLSLFVLGVGNFVLLAEKAV